MLVRRCTVEKNTVCVRRGASNRCAESTRLGVLTVAAERWRRRYNTSKLIRWRRGITRVCCICELVTREWHNNVRPFHQHCTHQLLRRLRWWRRVEQLCCRRSRRYATLQPTWRGEARRGRGRRRGERARGCGLPRARNIPTSRPQRQLLSEQHWVCRLQHCPHCPSGL